MMNHRITERLAAPTRKDCVTTATAPPNPRALPPAVLEVPWRVVPADRAAALAPGGDVAVLRADDGRLERAPGGAAVRLPAAVRAGDRRPAVRGALGRPECRDRLLLGGRGADGDP